MRQRAYIALGSNLDTPPEQIRQALQAIGKLPETELGQVSSWYQTEAIGGPAGQPDYINAACVLETRLSPLDLLHSLQKIETDAGRVRDVRWGPRTLDLDIIWYQGVSQQTAELTLPHPRAHLRAFVLQPLMDIGADFQLEQASLVELRAQLSDQKVCEISERP